MIPELNVAEEDALGHAGTTETHASNRRILHLQVFSEGCLIEDCAALKINTIEFE